eukprot:CAMPEP_0174246290 /NCGR_PEP_ID=MMETSP0417-20130205/41998_1 /TAXON_ID=242541 /ORGANISM="Mayorella sp, Strain BSH-02190019" /LENGTH=44 /DNA_ID= /DNA_START= /DNA_END= /DNA_ORIENTATION=
MKVKLDLQVVYGVALMALAMSIFAVSLAYTFALIIEESFYLETW